jgi:type VI protein secretion system component Hcp
MHTRTTLSFDDHPPTTVRSWRHQITQPLTRDPRQADPRVPGRSKHEELSVTRVADALTPFLLHACSAGARIGRARLTVDVAPPLDEALPHAPGVLTLDLRDVLITSVLSSPEDGLPLETITLSYASVRWAWTPPDGATLEHAWQVHG